MKVLFALLSTALFLLLALSAQARADTFNMDVSWVIPSGGGNVTPTPGPTGGIIWRPSPIFTFAIRGFTTIVDFFGSSNKSVDFWYWQFGDGDSASTQNATHEYQNVGLVSTYSVVFQHCNGLVCTSSTQYVTVVNWPNVVLALTIGTAALIGIPIFLKSDWVRDLNRRNIRIISEKPKVNARHVRMVQRQVRKVIQNERVIPREIRIRR